MIWLLKDIIWAIQVIRARAHRRTLIFSQRLEFDKVLRPILTPLIGNGNIDCIDYPDAIYYITKEDVDRAIEKVGKGPYSFMKWRKN